MAQPRLEDLTARARIRDAALKLFTERGIEGTTVRDIAQEAGVSPGLLRHHFGSKEALREACDAYALDELMHIKQEAVVDGQISNAGFLGSVQPTVLRLYRYLARALLDGSPAAAKMFDDMVVIGEQWIERFIPGEYTDLRAYSAVVVASSIGMLAMHDHLSRALGADTLSPEGHLRMSRGLVDLHSHALLDPEQAAQMYAGLDQAQGTRPTPTKRRSAAKGAQ